MTKLIVRERVELVVPVAKRARISLTTFLWPPCSGRKGAGSPELQSALAALERDIQFETNNEVRRAEEAAQQYPWERINEPVPDYLDE